MDDLWMILVFFLMMYSIQWRLAMENGPFRGIYR